MGICDWANVNEKMKLYHDCEWGVPVYDDTVQFEYLVLELMQSGLSWNTILQKRETLKSAYANFNYEVLADYGPEETDKIMTCEGIIRQRRKIEAVFQNARALKTITENSDRSAIIYGAIRRERYMSIRVMKNWEYRQPMNCRRLLLPI